MNTLVIRWQAFKHAVRRTHSLKTWHAGEPLARASRIPARLLLALAPALAVMVVATWAVSGGGHNGVLQACVWASGFVFLALAVDTPRAGFTPLLVTGLALPVLALASAHIAVEFALLAALIVAGWVAAAVLRATARG